MLVNIKLLVCLPHEDQILLLPTENFTTLERFANPAAVKKKCNRRPNSWILLEGHNLLHLQLIFCVWLAMA